MSSAKIECDVMAGQWPTAVGGVSQKRKVRRQEIVFQSFWVEHAELIFFLSMYSIQEKFFYSYACEGIDRTSQATVNINPPMTDLP